MIITYIIPEIFIFLLKTDPQYILTIKLLKSIGDSSPILIPLYLRLNTIS